MSRPVRPFVIRRDGTLEDRASGTPIGRVWLDRSGWFADSPWTTYGPAFARHFAARQAWAEWDRKRKEPRA